MEFSRVSVFYVLLLIITFIPFGFFCVGLKPMDRSVVPADINVCGFVYTLHKSSY